MTRKGNARIAGAAFLLYIAVGIRASSGGGDAGVERIPPRLPFYSPGI